MIFETFLCIRVKRDRGSFGRVSVFWQIYQVYRNGSLRALISEDFDQTSGTLVFGERENSKDLVLSISSDDMAEYEESFEVVLENVTGDCDVLIFCRATWMIFNM